MDKFTSEFFRNQIEEWKNNYFNYIDILHFIQEQSKESKVNISSENIEQYYLNKNELIKNFITKVEMEFNKVYTFYLSQKNKIYSFINKQIYSKESYQEYNSSDYESQFNQLIQSSNQMCFLTTFIYENIGALDHILQKFDGYFVQLKPNVHNYYIATHFSNQSDLLEFFSFEFIDEMFTLFQYIGNELLNSYKLLVKNPQQIKNNELKQSSLIESVESYKPKIIPLSIMETKFNTIISNIESIEKIYQKLQSINRKWIRIYSYSL